MPYATYLQDADVPILVEQIQKLPRSENETVLLLVGEHSKFDLPDLLAALNQQQIPFAGGVFTGVIYGDQRFESGIVADVLPLAVTPSVVHGLDTRNFALDHLP